MVFLHWSGDCVRLCGGWQNFMLASVYHKEKNWSNGWWSQYAFMHFGTDCRHKPGNLPGQQILGDGENSDSAARFARGSCLQSQGGHSELWRLWEGVAVEVVSCWETPEPAPAAHFYTLVIHRFLPAAFSIEAEMRFEDRVSLFSLVKGTLILANKYLKCCKYATEPM